MEKTTEERIEDAKEAVAAVDPFVQMAAPMIGAAFGNPILAASIAKLAPILANVMIDATGRIILTLKNDMTVAEQIEALKKSTEDWPELDFGENK